MDDDITEAVNTSQKNKDRKKHVQCIHLYDCIQAAVAKMLENNDEYQQSATLRINLLLTIIPEKPEFPLGKLIITQLCHTYYYRYHYILWCTSKTH